MIKVTRNDGFLLVQKVKWLLKRHLAPGSESIETFLSWVKYWQKSGSAAHSAGKISVNTPENSSSCPSSIGSAIFIYSRNSLRIKLFTIISRQTTPRNDSSSRASSRMTHSSLGFRVLDNYLWIERKRLNWLTDLLLTFSQIFDLGFWMKVDNDRRLVTDYGCPIVHLVRIGTSTLGYYL